MEKKWFIGIDVSKKTLDVVLYVSNKKHSDESNYTKVSNNEEGYLSLLAWMKERKLTRSNTVILFEDTGFYSFDLSLFLESRSMDYCRLTPLHLKRSLGLVRGKNDRVDAERIAYFGYIHREELTYSRLSGSAIIRLRDLSAERKRFVTHLAENKALLTDRKGHEQTSTLERAEKMTRVLEEEIHAIEEEMTQLVASDAAIERNYSLLVSIKGIGAINAINTIIHTNNFQSFQTARQYACYLGIAPFEHSSGTSVRGKTRVQATGAKQLKADITQAAKSCVKWDNEMKTYYERKSKEGKAHGVIMNAVKFKLVGRMFAVVRRGEPFVEWEKYKN